MLLRLTGTLLKWVRRGLESLLPRPLRSRALPNARPARGELSCVLGVDVRSLVATPRRSRAETQERIQAGRVAELTTGQAGL